MKKLIIVALCITLVGCFTACIGEKSAPKCEHQFSAATCQSPATCTKCGKAEGEPLSHKYSVATCEAAATCSLCGNTDGFADGHSFSGGTCTTAATCSVCGAADPAPVGHDFSAATCTAAATCTKCGTTDGSAKGHSFVGATCSAEGVCSVCGAKGSKGSHSYSGNACVHCGKALDPSSSYIVSLSKGTPIYAGPGKSYDLVENLSAAGKFTIVDEKRDSAGNLWGELKSGKGWVIVPSNASAKATVTASEISLSSVKSGHKFYSVNNTEYSTVVSFRISKTVKNVCFASSVGTGDDPKNHFTLSSLSANTPLSVQIELHDFSTMYLSFDDNGKSRYFSIYVSGRDGSLVVTEE